MRQNGNLLAGKIKALMDRHGVSTMYCTFRDPDTGECFTVTTGDRYWRIGMLTMNAQIEIQDAIKETGEPSEL